ncbi:2-hydroxychromene-2-carboxylate isomerase [Pararhizobium haloflavum]|uniref:2-hydroxychromene-2-carboxylate isomerase n=1 Tax=Pararhizobium haloflavum TaxID=2037914 RepID=UPI000C1A4BC1|nr:2-hydroxychromene-2-carboxylate isomerase [Pararhizobium haloflavum]
MANIDYYFAGISPFSYLGHRAIEAVARKHGCGIAYKPVILPELFEVSGALPPAKRPPVRQRYRLLELQRVAEMRGLPINLKPKHFPVDPALADQAVIALLDARQDPTDYMFRVFSAVWAQDENVSDPRVVERVLDESGFDGAAFLEAAQSESVAETRRQNTKEAIEADAVGVPAYVLNGEVFWGQDRIELLDRALESGRAPFHP